MDSTLFDRQLSPADAERGYAEVASRAADLRQKHRRNQHIARYGTATVAAVVIAGGIGIATLDNTTTATAGAFNPRIITPTQHPVTESISAQSGAEQTLMNSILKGMDSKLFVSTGVGSPPAGVNSADSWTSFTMRYGAPSGADSVRSYWEAALVAGAYRDRSTDAGVQPNTGFTIKNVTADGTPAPDSGGDQVLGPKPSQSATDYTPSQIVKKIADNFPTHQLIIKSISFVNPDHLAPVVVAMSTDPQGFVNSDYDLTSIFGDVNSYEGVYVELVDPQGKPFMAIGVAPRIDVVSRWTRPGIHNPSADGLPNGGNDARPISTQ